MSYMGHLCKILKFEVVLDLWTNCGTRSLTILTHAAATFDT